MYFIADDPDDVVGTVTPGFRRLGSKPYPGDRSLDLSMAFRRNGLAAGPSPLSLERDLAAIAAYDLIRSAPPRAPRLAPRAPHYATPRTAHLAKPRTAPNQTRTTQIRELAPTLPLPRPRPLPLPLTSTAAKRGAYNCPGLEPAALKQLLQNIERGETSLADKENIFLGHSAISERSGATVT